MLVECFYIIKTLRACRNSDSSGEQCCKKKKIFPFFYIYIKKDENTRKTRFVFSETSIVVVRVINHRSWIFAYLLFRTYTNVPTSRSDVKTILLIVIDMRSSCAYNNIIFNNTYRGIEYDSPKTAIEQNVHNIIVVI